VERLGEGYGGREAVDLVLLQLHSVNGAILRDGELQLILG
jgi:hypothetical protein